MVHPVDVNRGSVWLPRFQAEIPVSLYINGRQIPPIEAEGEIISISSACMQIRCDSKIPIPSHGIIRFNPNGGKEELALNVDFVQRVEITKSGWFWNVKPKYEMRAALQGNASIVESRYKHFINDLIFTAERDETSHFSAAD